MGAWALLLPLLMATAQAQVCSVNNTIFEVQENTNQSGPLADIYVPAGQQVTLGQSSTPYAFRIQGTQLFLNVTPDYEENTMLQAHLECRSGDTVVTQLRVLVFVLDINDNAPQFPFENKVKNISEDTKVNTIVIPETELEAQDLDKDDILFYTLQEVTPGASNFFSLVGTNLPALRLDQPLDFYSWQKMTFQLLVRDTQEENAEPSHTAAATLDLHVWPADLRPPWFLPCGYSDPYVCINAEYHGAVPLGHKLPAPLVLRPGPVHAVDGDQGISQRILYSIMQGQDGTFAIDADSGNLTMTRSVPSPKTFTLLVKGEQADRARYSVTRVTIEARNAIGSLPYFPKSRYYGQVARGSGAGVEVKDATAPSLPLRIWAQDPDFPDINSAITYRITNNTNFRMDGETMLTTVLLANETVFYAEVEANNTVTTGTATTVVEIQVLEWEEPSPTEPPQTGGGSTPGHGEPSTSRAEDRRFSVVDMAALGGVLGALLLLALTALLTLLHKHYGQSLKCCSGKAPDRQPLSFDNQAFVDTQEDNWAPAPRSSPGPTRAVAPEPPEPPEPPPPEPPSAAAARPASESPEVARDGGGPAAVRSILTKERRPEGGYKAVWFGEDIGAEADVVVLNTPASEAARAADSGSEVSSDEDADAEPDDDAPGAGSTYV
ncbi:cadherin-related family member 5 isoform X3 [Zalophus californianus]|uniref:Cadherin-related family member 5 n=1 Tax=Zalophus californianus TaxID=9704 RepID=A0A6J2BNU7_ZALCA|nr:cadherin-related family member 5 isoform X3 [Zalophus californianus]